MRRKIEKPSKEELKLVRQFRTILETARMYEVSYALMNNWLKEYGLIKERKKGE